LILFQGGRQAGSNSNFEEKKEQSHARAAQARAPREGAKTQSSSSNFQAESI